MNFNQWGLICNIIGTIIIAIYGLPNWYYAEDGGTFMTRKINVIEGKKHNRRRKITAYSGLTVLGIGFILQLIASFCH